MTVVTHQTKCPGCRPAPRVAAVAPVASGWGYGTFALVLAVFALVGAATAGRLAAPEKTPEKAPSAPEYAKDVAPLIDKYCVRCHTSAKPSGKVALDKDKDDGAIRKKLALWERVGDNLRSGDMPPEGEKKPTAAEMDRINRWLDAVVFEEKCTGPQKLARVTIRRLNRAEYDNTIRDLIGVDFRPAKDFPADDVGHGFDNIGDVLTIPPLLMEKYLVAAEKVVEAAFRKPESRKLLMPKQPRDKGATPSNLKQFASRAWRRPATDDEVKRLMRFVQFAREQGDEPAVGLKLAFQAVLVSPHFLFRVELDRHGDKTGPLNDYELASRLSYFLWSSMPDEELFRLAEQKKLHDPATLEAQVKRMLDDKKAVALAQNFAFQWLNLRNLAGFSPDPKRFPTFTPSLRAAMLRETEEFFLHVVRQDRPLTDFLDGDYTFVNEELARFYGLPGVKGNTFQKVSLKGTPRGGILTHASVLAVTSNPTRTSPVKRGKWILENILGTPPPPPPENVGELKDEGELTGTMRQQLEQHRADPNCAGCHARMDPLGFGFENFSAVGAWRATEGKHKIDASGVLPDGSKFTGPAELRTILVKKKDAFAKTLTEKVMTYAIGRGTERTDRCFVEDIATNVAKKDYRFRQLILEIVQSDPFLKRRAKGAGK
jgi:Protein of unknown function (DUF1592)/Protein of unknown function (DUF1588)/Protein of unknown function (DUF1585)/Protein of unknown function (DUF1587)/Protein of unknown function (DUF1595)